jgi:hypothetical protein
MAKGQPKGKEIFLGVIDLGGSWRSLVERQDGSLATYLVFQGERRFVELYAGLDDFVEAHPNWARRFHARTEEGLKVKKELQQLI